MRLSSSQLHERLSSTHSSLTNRRSTAIVDELLSTAPQNTKGICYEFRPMENYRPCDVLLAYECTNYSLSEIESFLELIPNSISQGKILNFISERKSNPLFQNLNLVWFSFDWNSDHFPSIPTFYISTQHYKYDNDDLLHQVSLELVNNMAESHVTQAQSVLDALKSCRLNHIGFTYAREAIKTKFVLSVHVNEINSLLDTLNWQGDYTKLSAILHIAKSLSEDIQISLSFDTVLSKKIEIELPWVANAQQNYLKSEFIQQVAEVCDTPDGYQNLTEITSWLHHTNLDCAFYTKFSLFEDSSVNFKAYLHCAPIQINRFVS
ncbi:hypothetical protein [Pseudoalteromonas luteoviolacea]|nr:hypothetical protein [Pseudoalteromonas luteoviolacea]